MARTWQRTYAGAIYLSLPPHLGCRRTAREQKGRGLFRAVQTSSKTCVPRLKLSLGRFFLRQRIVARARSGVGDSYLMRVSRQDFSRRDAPCPCGSGKKYKKCCMKTESGGDTAPVMAPRPTPLPRRSSAQKASLDEQNATLVVCPNSRPDQSQ
jgi:hypothetical protein